MKYGIFSYGFSNYEGFYPRNHAYTDTPEEAVHMWFKFQKIDPGCVDLCVQDKNNVSPVVEWCRNNLNKIKEWSKKYESPYKVEFIQHRILDKADHFDCGVIQPFSKG